MKSALYRLALALRDVRETDHVSLTEHAEWSGFTKGHLSRVERGLAAPSRELVDTYEARFATDGLLQSHYLAVLDE